MRIIKLEVDNFELSFGGLCGIQFNSRKSKHGGKPVSTRNFANITIAMLFQSRNGATKEQQETASSSEVMIS